MEYTSVIVAAGKGTRMGLGYNKVYYKLDDKSILEHTIAAFKKDKDCTQIVVVCDEDDFVKYVNDGGVDTISGGKTRSHSVYNGLSLVKNEYVMIHDGARPYVSQKVLDNIKHALEGCDACLAMVDCKDTIKQVVDGKVVTTFDRSTLKHAQTPQAFKTSKIKACYDKYFKNPCEVSDDASVYELYGSDSVIAVEGDYANIKITTVEDI